MQRLITQNGAPLQAVLALCLGLLLGLSATGVSAQGRFDPVLRVDERVITRYQIDERTRLLALLNAPGDPRNLAREQLVDEAIQNNAADVAGIALSEEELRGGLEEFAGRVNLTADEFIEALAQNGVSAETFRDFVSTGVRWRTYIRERFGDDARDIPTALVNQTLAQTGTEGGLRVLLSEIRLPMSSEATTAASRARAAEIAAIQTESDFNAAARQFSAAPSRARGGELNWVAAASLPDEIRTAVAGLSPGQTSRPVDLPDSIAIYFLRDSELVPASTPSTGSVDYALFVTEGPASKTIDELDVCDDLYAVAKGLPEDRLVRETVALSTLPQDLRLALAGLDDNEATTVVRGGRPAILMLCGRVGSTQNTVDFEIVGTRLLNQKLSAMAEHHLVELRARTFVENLTN